MTTSELSDALNPYAAQRPRPIPEYLTPTIQYPTHLQSPIQSYSPQQHPFHSAVQPAHFPQTFVPHRSELELAVSEPVINPPQPLSGPGEGGHVIQELFRMVSSTREAQEIERKRRLAWEQEQEAKYAQRQAQTERELFDMRQEMELFRSNIKDLRNSQRSGVLTSHCTSPVSSEQRSHQPVSPVSPVLQTATHANQVFVQGSSSDPLSAQPSYYHAHQFETTQDRHPQEFVPSSQSITPTPSPQLTLVEASRQFPENNTSRRKSRKRQNSELSGSTDSSSSESSGQSQSRPQRRINHHDKRCLTINHAMRAHFLRLMQLETDKDLPDSHTEGVVLVDSDPVRFVWDKTTKQSVHNARMKARIIADIKDERGRYKHVSTKDFNKKTLETVFEQCFTTFRQKFRAQRDTLTALNQKNREDAKARKSRHVSRRKVKLNNRAEARMKLPTLEHVTFDGALQIECMSSEESDVEQDPSGTPSLLLRTHGYAWRSTRLLRFYHILDEEEQNDKSSKPKRGVGKKERFVGPTKEGFHLPPKGVATWMISRRWIHSAQVKHPDLHEALKNLVIDPEGFDWNRFDLLGHESEVEGDMQTFGSHVHNLAMHQQLYTSSSSSLNFALA
ncbi:uncharacterized protein LACBIDRAFT_311674 [Laccaria bicolor S238N-H82]|uniref:Predicted protein n=1 Tax=Laccaria bicolor (strain S238N-H82 / ATCC MYA-4686) TaxID=486041 RepID=B0CY03_LACBS|nr:uncharacterized protein LACBIDRAFT_311674 [Laccaria bicolor S238N-H82]EDR12809.1 predicted protein [Laccaria bicolor S238N-H82]|eukprot:XP_001877073.1 predicted protein [Laccaria bicolor S238N-H82]